MGHADVFFGMAADVVSSLPHRHILSVGGLPARSSSMTDTEPSSAAKGHVSMMNDVLISQREQILNEY